MHGANPVFESLGNATTVRNGNSSRFGKYNTLKFNPVGSLVGTEVHSYLLESSRVVHFADGERTYHVFYEMLAGASKEMLDSFYLDANSEYRLLHKQKLAASREDAKNFEALVSGLSLVDISEVKQQQIFRTLAGLIHLGEVSFRPVNEDHCEVHDKKHFRLGAELLGFDVDVMDETLCERHVSVKQMDRVSVYKVKRSVREATETLESLMKKIYERTFDYIVGIMNGNLVGTTSDRGRHIGILDIYGFEQLQVNSFEQMCINLANERLQTFFVVNVLVAEQVVYKQEGLAWTPIDVKHSDGTTNALTDVMTLLDNYGILFASKQQQPSARSFDEKFTEYVHQQLGGPCILEPKRGRAVAVSLATNQGFVVKHYAGEVTYSTDGWLQKNNARLQYQMECLLRDSTEWLPSNLCDLEGCDRGTTPFTSVARKYLKDLQTLLDTLQGCNLRYIRCFKPNDKQVPNCFDAAVVREQLVQSGTIELVKIMHLGYPHRCGFDEIKDTFLSKLPQDLRDQDARMLLGALMQVLGLKSGDWAVGLTRVFLKNGQLAILDKLVGATGDEAMETASKLRSHLRRVKFVRCVNVVRIARWLPKYIKKMRLVQVRNGFVRCCQNLLRIQRWVRRARRHLRAERLNRTICRLQSTVRLLSGLQRWRYRCRKGKVVTECVQALIRFQERFCRAEQQRFFDTSRRTIAEQRYRVTVFARHALLVAKLRAYIRRRRHIRALFVPLVRLTRLKIYAHRYISRVRARLERERERQERISLLSELEQLRVANGEKDRIHEELEQLRIANAEKERIHEELEELRLANAEKECLHRKEMERAELEYVQLQEQRNHEKERKHREEVQRMQEQYAALQQERQEEAEKVAAAHEQVRTMSSSMKEIKRANSATRARTKKVAEPPTMGPTMSAELARLRSENLKLRERVSVGAEDSDPLELRRLREENERLRAKNAQEMRERTAVGVQYLMEENERLKRRPDVPSSEVERLKEENRTLKEERAALKPVGQKNFERLKEENHTLKEERAAEETSPLRSANNSRKVRPSLLSDDGDICALTARFREGNQELRARVQRCQQTPATGPSVSPQSRRYMRLGTAPGLTNTWSEVGGTQHCVRAVGIRDVNVVPDPVKRSSWSSFDPFVGSPRRTRHARASSLSELSPTGVATPSRANGIAGQGQFILRDSRRHTRESSAGTSPPWNPERSYLANASMIAQRTAPNIESLDNAFSSHASTHFISKNGRDASGAAGAKNGANAIPGYLTPPSKKSAAVGVDGHPFSPKNSMMLLSPLSLDSLTSNPDQDRFRAPPDDHMKSFARFNMDDEVRSRLKQPVIRRKA
eukprot:GEMP01000770.1.p1 GENE.GEMP01000770.1~~GEMP01000770.1.p1  ORF type:complete len:1557 (+),score=357.15 GEMP01000770.1:673-4671(+)